MRSPSTLARLLSLTLCVVVGGCASVSQPAAPAATAAAQGGDTRPLPAWDSLATDLAERIVNRLSEISAPAAEGEATPLSGASTPTLATQRFKLQAPVASPFEQALLTLLSQRLLGLGLTLDDQQPSGHIEVGVQLIERDQRPPLVLVSTQVRALGRLQTSTADLYTLVAADLPLFTAPAAPATIKTWRMATP